jgi:hypothetical protein
MSIVWTAPGKIGDALLQWPIVYHYHKQNGGRATMWLDEKSLKPLVPLFESQPVVEKVELKPGIENYSMGGQPWDFALGTAEHIEHQIFHLGMRSFPQRQITLQTIEWMPFKLRNIDWTEPTIQSTLPVHFNRCVLHGTFQSTAGTPGFWRFLNSIKEELDQEFEQVVFVGTADERERAMELYPYPGCERPHVWHQFDDGGDFAALAGFMGSSRLVIGSGSSGVVLGGALKIPTIRVHDPIGDVPKTVWSNLGNNQLNATERELRTAWPKFKTRWIEQRIEVPV